jgi:hypothetical protein
MFLERIAQFGLIANKTQRDLARCTISLARGWNENLGSNLVKDRFMRLQAEGRLVRGYDYDSYSVKKNLAALCLIRLLKMSPE